jgi:hypothetical protein
MQTRQRAADLGAGSRAARRASSQNRTTSETPVGLFNSQAPCQELLASDEPDIQRDGCDPRCDRRGGIEHSAW